MKILNYIIYIFISFTISLNISKLSIPFILEDVNGSNAFSLTYAYLLENNDIEFNMYNENGGVEVNLKYFLNKSIVDANLDTPVDKLFQTTDFFLVSNLFLPPFLNSHKIELVLHGKGNIFLFKDLTINERIVSSKEIITNLIKNHDIELGVIYDRETILVKLLKDTVNLDLTPILKPITLTKAEQKQFETDYNFLSYIYFGLCFFLVFSFILILSKKLKGKLFRTILTIIAILSSVNLSFLLINYDATLKAGSYLENLKLFEQNYIPLLILILFPLIFCGLSKNKWFKALLSIIPITFMVILLIDNCLQIALNVRFNFRFAGFTGDIKYVYDFIIMYLLTPSAWLMILSLVLTFILGIILIKSDSTYKTSSLIYYFTLLIVTSIWGSLPPEETQVVLSKISNVFQVNGYSFYAVGDINKDYEDIYEPRDTLNFNWEEHIGQNKQKNVIIILVESWSCNITKICGTTDSYMPKLEKIAKDNWLFTNYHSMVQSTSISLFSVLKSIPAITLFNRGKNLQNKFNKKLYLENDLLTNFKNNGYRSMFISSTDNVYGMAETISNVSFDEEIYADDKAFSDIKDRYVFNSVNDNVMFDYIINRLKHEKSDKFIYVTKTASNHSPYNTPIGYRDIQKAFKYSDDAVAKFISELDKMDYFKDGIVVLFGDHPVWADINKQITNFELYNVPLVIIDGENKGVVNSRSFSHASLGVLLQDLMLPKYKMNRFNSNPLLDNFNYDREPLFIYDFDKPNELEIKFNQKEGKLVFSGNDSYIKPRGVFTEDEEKLILGFVAWIK